MLLFIDIRAASCLQCLCSICLDVFTVHQTQLLNNYGTLHGDARVPVFHIKLHFYFCCSRYANRCRRNRLTASSKIWKNSSSSKVSRSRSLFHPPNTGPRAKLSRYVAAERELLISCRRRTSCAVTVKWRGPRSMQWMWLLVLTQQISISSFLIMGCKSALEQSNRTFQTPKEIFCCWVWGKQPDLVWGSGQEDWILAQRPWTGSRQWIAVRLASRGGCLWTLNRSWSLL